MDSSSHAESLCVDRRAFDRLRLDCPARLVTPASYRLAHLRDLSQSGARLSLDKPPAEGTTALLRWAAYESLCTVVWASDVACGVAFESLIPSDWVSGGQQASLGDGERRVAGVTKIEFGNKRRSLAPAAGGPATQERVDHACWTLVLARFPHPRRLTRANMSAAEEMFFLGSPLAHVVQFEGTEPSIVRC